MESYCDSEEEVFFGPVTEKEKLIYKALKTKEIHNGDAETDSTRYVGGDEGLHALAEAASMLSISSGEDKEVRVKQETMAEEELSFRERSPLLHEKGKTEMMNGNEGSTMELDAVKFLTKHIPEQNGKYDVNSQAEYMDETYQSPEIVHHTSLASSVGNNSCSFNNPVSANSPVDSFLVLEAQCEVEASNIEDSTNFSMETVNINAVTDSMDKKCGNLVPICELEQLPPLNLSSIELQNVNDKSDFEMKLSDNEEEIEKVERNLKVEEIIKFLAEEDTKTDPGEKKETNMENAGEDESYQNCPPQNGTSKLNEDDDDVIIIEINDDEIVDLTDCQSHAIEEFSTNIENNVKCELSSMDPVYPDEGIKMEIAPKEEPIEVNVPLLDDDIKKEIQSNNESIDDHEMHARNVKIENESKDELVNLPSAPKEERDEKQIFDEVIEIPRLPLDEGDKKKVSSLPVMKQHAKVSSLNSKEASVTQRRLKTPSKVLLRPVHGSGTTHLHKQTSISDTKRHPAPLMSPLPTKNAISSARTPLKGMSSTTGSSFKTPNSKTNTMAASKIPHPITPSPRKNKYADIMSPVAQYIHGKSALLVANKNAPAVKSTLHRELIKSKTGVSDQTASVDRGAENIDVNNISSAPIPSSINYKSAVPVKIFSPSPIKCQGNGPVGSVSKHIGRIKITSLKSGEVQMPLAMHCRESLIPDGEVSILLTKETSGEHISTL